MAKTATDAPRATLFVMDPDALKIITDPRDPLFDPRGIEDPDPAMVASIRVFGVDKPVKGYKDGDDVVVLDGRRRVIAAREAKRLNLECGGAIPKVKVELHRGDRRGAVLKMVLGNFSPKEESIVAKAQKASTLYTQNYTDEEIGIAFGVSAATVKNWLAVLGLSEAAQQALSKGAVRLTDAVKLRRLSHDEQPAAVAKLEQERPTRAARKASGEKFEHKVTPVARLRRLERFVAHSPGAVAPEIALLMDWLRGGADDGELLRVFPTLEPMMAPAPEAHAANSLNDEAA